MAINSFTIERQYFSFVGEIIMKQRVTKTNVYYKVKGSDETLGIVDEYCPISEYLGDDIEEAKHREANARYTYDECTYVATYKNVRNNNILIFEGSGMKDLTDGLRFDQIISCLDKLVGQYPKSFATQNNVIYIFISPEDEVIDVCIYYNAASHLRGTPGIVNYYEYLVELLANDEEDTPYLVIEFSELDEINL